MVYTAQATEFMNEPLRARELMLGAWLAAGEMCMLYAPTGSGKSFFATALAHAAAIGGSFLGYPASRRYKVCYIEAEMPAITFQSRLKQIDDAAPKAVEPGQFFIIRRDDRTNNIPNIGTEAGVREMVPLVRPYDLVIIDNLTTCAPPTRSSDNDLSIWYRVREFLFAMRAAGKTVILIHHAGKSGAQLGTVLRENDMDLIISIKRPARPLDPRCLSMEVAFDKARSINPEDKINLYVEFSIVDEKAHWSWMSMREAQRAMVRRFKGLTSSKPLLAKLLNISYLDLLEILEEIRVEEAQTEPGGVDEWWDK